ncbi:MAG: dihydrofolate reductase family protein [Actinomycetota bacterium]|nr:dihydrofolate reductase family protein [Actinomycetota bacterium]
MPRLRVHNLSISLDGFAAGRNQGRDDPLGEGGEELHEWVFNTRYWREMLGESGGEEGVSNDFMIAGDENIGATIMGRNMFGPIRGEWGDEDWTGWWGDEPPYHHDVFVLTHFARGDIQMEGGTTFRFVTDGVESALRRALEAAGGRDVRLGGGASTVQQYLRAGLIDRMHVAITPVVLGAGERLFENMDSALTAYRCTEFVGTDGVTHAVLTR